MDHLINPDLVRQFEWDAQKVSRFDGERYMRIFTEPWTGTRFWDVQVRKSELFHLEITLTSYEDVAARGSKNGVPRTLCGQDPALVVRNGKGIPCHGEDS